MLFRKAASLYNTHQYNKATYILSELIKINPEDNTPALFYKKCRLKARPMLLNKARATSVFLLFLTALIISIEVLFVRPFYTLHVPLVMAVRNSLFILGCLTIIFGFGYNYHLANQDMQKFVENARQKVA